MQQMKLQIRIDQDNQNHHLYRNNGTYWVAYTEVDRTRKRRVRSSLKTKDVTEARARRDELFNKRNPGANTRAPIISDQVRAVQEEIHKLAERIKTEPLDDLHRHLACITNRLSCIADPGLRADVTRYCLQVICQSAGGPS